MKTRHHSIASTPLVQTGGQTLNNTIVRNWFAAGLGALLFSSLTALLPSPAQAQCQRWNVSGLWELRLGDETILILNLQQDWQGQSARITGTASRELTPKGAQTKTLSGINSAKVSGTLTQTSFAMEVKYPSFTSRYKGKINPNTGRMEGNEEDGMREHWVSSKTFSCGLDTPSEAKPTPVSTDIHGANEPNKKGRGFINGLQLPTPSPSAETNESSSNDTEGQQGQHKKNKKDKKKHHHHHDDDDQNQGND